MMIPLDDSKSTTEPNDRPQIIKPPTCQGKAVAGDKEDRPHTTDQSKPTLDVFLAAPRGFCAGVTRAIEAVETALQEHGAPVYVRHQIVHNEHVLKRLEAMGAVFIDHVEEAQDGRPLVFSAHGSPATAHHSATARGLAVIDAACPLVLKVHNQVKRYLVEGKHIFVIGHKGHAEVTGVMGQGSPSDFTLIQNCNDARRVTPPKAPLAYVTQTTLSVDDTRVIIEILKTRFPEITAPQKEDICYATTNRQAAVKTMAPLVDTVLVVGSPTSSNSKRLVEVALQNGAKNAHLVENPEAVDIKQFNPAQTIGVTAGASTPEELVEKLLTRLAGAFTLGVKTLETIREDVTFKAPLVKGR